MPLTLSNLTIGYDNHVLASNLDATLPTGKVTALIGRNGVGKSTLLRCVAGLRQPLGGAVLWNNTDCQTLSLKERAKYLSVVLTERPEVMYLTVADTVAIGRTPYTSLFGKLSVEDQTIIIHSMEQTEVAHLATRTLSSLSDGERQRVMIAKALAQQTPLIILDEPTSFLDFRAKMDIFALLQHLAHEEKKTILLSTHEVEMALRMVDQLWLLQDKMLISGCSTELYTSGELSTFFAHDGIEIDATTWSLLPNSDTTNSFN